MYLKFDETTGIVKDIFIQLTTKGSKLTQTFFSYCEMKEVYLPDFKFEFVLNKNGRVSFLYSEDELKSMDFKHLVTEIRQAIISFINDNKEPIITEILNVVYSTDFNGDTITEGCKLTFDWFEPKDYEPMVKPRPEQLTEPVFIVKKNQHGVLYGEGINTMNNSGDRFHLHNYRFEFTKIVK